MGTIFWGESYHRGVTVGGWGVTVGVAITLDDITVKEGWFVTMVGA